MNSELKRFRRAIKKLNLQLSGKHREVRFPGLSNAADALGVHRNHLHLVLSGKRVSKSLMQRYHNYQLEVSK